MSDTLSTARPPRRASAYLFRLATWLLAFGCFYLVYARSAGAAAREGVTVTRYLADFFAAADWTSWLALMIPYSVFFFLVDAHATWRVVRWFNAPSLRFVDMLPIRASAYILSLVNEQVGKGAMSLYLLKRHRVPGWEALSSMILLALVEVYQLLCFAAVGLLFYGSVLSRASTQLPLDRILPAVFVVAIVYLPLHIAYFRGRIAPASKVRDRAIFKAFREARPIHYLLVLLFKAPTVLAGIVVYALALGLFHVPVSMSEMFALLPLIFLAAALPLPFHAGALVLWTVLFPEYPAVGVFSAVMHTFFVVMNALIGVLFLPRANKELFAAT